MPRGGKRSGAGRPKGTGKFSESTKAIRVPESMVERILEYAHAGGFKLPLYGGKVAAGCPAPTDDYIEGMIDLGEYLIHDPASTFFVRVVSVIFNRSVSIFPSEKNNGVLFSISRLPSI